MCAAQPRQITEIKQFLLTARRSDAKSVRIKKNGNQTKFKVRCTRFLYTLCVEDNDKADKLKQSLPPGATPARLNSLSHSSLYRGNAPLQRQSVSASPQGSGSLCSTTVNHRRCQSPHSQAMCPGGTSGP